MPGRIAVSVLDGHWETLGSDRDPGNEPYGIAATYNDWGPDTLAFNIRRDPAVEHADLVAYTPVRYYPDGGDRMTWAGFLLERPGGNEADPSIAGVARGWQYHLDDDVAPALFVHANMADWQDIRTHIAAYLVDFPSSLTCNVSDGQALCGWPGGGVPIPQNTGAGVLLDFGPDPNCWPLRLECNVSYPDPAGLGAGPSTTVYLRCADSPAFFTGVGGGILGTNLSEFFAGASVSGNIGGTVTVARRYCGIFVWRGGASGTTGAKDAQVAFRDIRAYRKAAYASAFASILKVSDIIKEVLPLAPLLDQSTADVATTALSIPHAAWPREPRPPRQTIDEWNAYHRYVRKIGGPGLNRLVFKPQPSRAVLRVDTEKPGARFADASISSGADIYNKALVRASSGAGEPLEVDARANNLDVAPLIVLPAAGQPLNPSADVDIANVDKNGGTLTRDTVVFHTAPASFKWVHTGAPTDSISWQFGPGYTFVAGEKYRVDFYARVGTGTVQYPFTITDLTATPLGSAALLLTTTFQAVRVSFTPLVDVDSDDLALTCFQPPAGDLYVDSIVVKRGRATVIDRRSFLRTYTLDVGSPSDPVAMAALGDAALGLHAATPLKGSLEVSDDTAVTELTTGRTVPMHELGLYVGELVHIANLSDPDVSGGTLGRNGKIAAVSGEGPVTLTIDNQRTAFEALLARMAVVRPRDPRK